MQNLPPLPVPLTLSQQEQMTASSVEVGSVEVEAASVRSPSDKICCS